MMDEAVFVNTSLLNLSVLGDVQSEICLRIQLISLFSFHNNHWSREARGSFQSSFLDSSPWGSTSQKGMNVLTCRTHFFPKYSFVNVI